MSATVRRLAEIKARATADPLGAVVPDSYVAHYRADAPGLVSAVEAVLAIADEKDRSDDLSDRLGAVRLRVEIARAMGVEP